MKLLRSLYLTLVLSQLTSAATLVAESRTISIGAVASLTGPAQDQGKNWLNGAQLAEEDLRADGIHVKLHVEDDTTNPGRAVSATQKLVAVDKVQAVVGGTWDFLAEASAPIATRANVPYVTVTNPIEVVSAQLRDLPLFFTNALSLARTGEALSLFLDEKKPQRVGIFAPEFPFTQKHADLAEKLCREKHITVVTRKNFTYDDFYSSVRVFGGQAARDNLDLVFIFTSADGLEPFLASYRSQGGKASILTTQHLDAALAATKNKALYENSYGVYPRIQDASFAARDEKRFNAPPRVYSAEGYDAVMFLARSLHAGFVPGLKEQQLEYRGVTGAYSLPTTGRQLGSTKAEIMMVRAGEFVAMK